ncbi:MAG: peptidoglycan DD-metalloendopeptidase family protein [Magnetococcales bacterium]|nr:peptidoglycan DD-metalloendopeptidase family protein [Magnetococcales bacterium]
MNARWHLLFWMVALGLFVLGSIAQANEELQGHVNLERGRMQLNRTVRELVREQEALGISRGETQSLLAELELLDRSMTEGEQRQFELVMRQKEAQRLQPDLESRINATRKTLAQQRRRLAQHLRLMYQLGSQGMLKTIFSQQSMASGNKSLLYLARIIKTRNQEFTEFRIAVARLRNDMAKSREVTATLATLQADLTKEQKIRQEERIKRAEFLQRARTEEQLHQKKVEELTQAKIRLTTFFDRLSTTLDQIPELPDIPTPTQTEPPDLPGKTTAKTATESTPSEVPSLAARINERRGRLPHPVPGSWENRPPGIFYRVAVKTPVAAIHAGQVVYADWFRGYGLLLILKHGDNVYSLYSHNQKILVAQGDWVKEKTIIAESGDTGSMDGVAGLYFEMRVKGKTISPVGWLAKQG